MNNKQKTLTLLAVAAFAVTALFAPWDLTGSPDHTNVLRYAPLFAPPSLDVWAKRELASGIVWSWLALAVIYAGLFVALREPTPSVQARNNEQLSHG
jgi:hypothetical protein